LCHLVTDLLTAQAGTTYTAYVVQKTTGYLMGTSVGIDIYNSTAGSFVKAVSCSNSVIAQSYQYLTNYNYLTSADLTTTYTTSNGSASQMRIVFTNLLDSSKTLAVDVVYVELL
jgi:hypothetical protein